MKEIGEKLKAARLEKGLKLDDVQQDLKIRRRYLEAIEEGRLEEIPGLVYARGFVRSYARFLGVDVEEAIARELSTAEEDVQEPPRVPAATPADQRPFPWGPLGIGAAVVAAVVVVLLIGRGHPARPQATTTPPAATQPSKGAPSSGSSSAQASSPPPQASAVQDAGPATVTEKGGSTIAGEAYDVSTGPVVATLTTTGPCWVEIRQDGAYVEARTLTAGSYTFQASSDLEMVLGRPKNVQSLTLNGQSVGTFKGIIPVAVVGKVKGT